MLNKEEKELVNELEAIFDEIFGEKRKTESEDVYGEEFETIFDERLGEDCSTELDNRIILSDEGEEFEFEFLDLIAYEGKEYIVLLPVEGSAEGDEVVILELEESDDGEESYVSVDDDNTLEVVFNIFKEKFKDEFNFVD